MAKNGLKNNLRPISILSIAKQAAEAAELRSKDRQRYSDSLLKYANLISVALKIKILINFLSLKKTPKNMIFLRQLKKINDVTLYLLYMS